jgi:hypothetical protein
MKTDLVVVVNPRRECYSCGSTETYVGRQKTSNKPNYHWYGNGIEDQWLCLRCENNLIKGPKYHPVTNPRRNKNHHKSCLDSPRLISDGRGPKGKPSSGRTENYSPSLLPSSMKVVGVTVRVSQFAHTNINTKTNKQQSDCGGA